MQRPRGVVRREGRFGSLSARRGSSARPAAKAASAPGRRTFLFAGLFGRFHAAAKAASAPGRLRALEAALFMIGYELPRTD